MTKKQIAAAKKAQARKNALNRQRFLDRLPSNEKEHLELMLWHTERAIGPHNDATMIAQAERIRLQIANLPKKSAI